MDKRQTTKLKDGVTREYAAEEQELSAGFGWFVVVRKKSTQTYYEGPQKPKKPRRKTGAKRKSARGKRNTGWITKVVFMLVFVLLVHVTINHYDGFIHIFFSHLKGFLQTPEQWNLLLDKFLDVITNCIAEIFGLWLGWKFGSSR